MIRTKPEHRFSVGKSASVITLCTYSKAESGVLRLDCKSEACAVGQLWLAVLPVQI